jgi:hypothetical protein
MDGAQGCRAQGGVWPEEEGGSNEWAPLISEREKTGGVLVRDGEMLGRGPHLGLGQKGPPCLLTPFLFCLFSFSVFKIVSFKTFAKEFQFKSNQKPRFSTIQHTLLKQ